MGKKNSNQVLSDRFSGSEYVSEKQAYNLLALAVCEQAVYDYKDLLLYGKESGEPDRRDTIESLEKFFRSDDFELLAGDVVDGEEVIKTVTDSIGSDIVEKRKAELEKKQLLAKLEAERKKRKRLNAAAKKQARIEKYNEKIKRDKTILEAALQKADGVNITSVEVARLLGCKNAVPRQLRKRANAVGFDLTPANPNLPASRHNPYILHRGATQCDF